MKSMKSGRGIGLTVSGSLVSLLCGAGAYAAEEAQSRDQRPGGIEEIVVTAQKREQSLQKVPATITALDSEALETRQIDDIIDLQPEVPSLVVGEFYGTSLITLRGISTGVTSGAEDPSVATHINGVYQPRSRSVDSALVDLDRVEVLSGPQGTLYGRNATGGVVNYILERPTEQFEGVVNGGGGNLDRVRAHARLSGPITENVSGLISGMYDEQDKGFTKNLLPNATHSRLETDRTKGGRVALDIYASGGVSLELDGIYLDTRTKPVASAFGPSGEASIQAFLGAQSFEPHEVYSNLDSFTRSEYSQVSGAVYVPLGSNIELKSITAYQKFEDDMLIDLDSSGVTSIHTLQDVDSETLTQELNLNVEALDGRLTAIFGLFYLDDEFTGESTTDFVVPGFAAPFITYSDISSKSYAAFTDHTFSVTDRLRVQAGIRFNRDEKEATQSLFIGAFAQCPLLTNDREWEAWTPRFGAQYDVSDDVMLYGQWSRGFKSGGFTSNSCYDDFDQEKIKGPEVGVKTRLLDNRVHFNLSAYYYEISNLQVQKVVDVGTFFVDNAAGAEIYGAEFSLNALLTPSLELNAAGMVQSAKYTSFENCDETAFLGACGAFDPRPPAERLTDVSDNWLNRAAPYSLSLGLQYTFVLGRGGSVLLRGESFFNGKVRYSEFASDEATQSSYDVQNLFAVYTSADETYSVRAYVKNVGNTDYKVSYFYNSAIRQGEGNWAAPRMYGVDATIRF
jgi:iron complex outermembrane receptor protein